MNSLNSCLCSSLTWITTPGFSANSALTTSGAPPLEVSEEMMSCRLMCMPPLVLAKHISSRVVMSPPAEMSWPAMIHPFSIICWTAIKASAKYSAFFTVGTSLPTLPNTCAKAEPPKCCSSNEKSIWYSEAFLSLTRTGLTTLRMSLTSPPALTITVPGDMIFSPLGYCWVRLSESLPVGTLMCRSQQKSLSALTPAYRRASSPSCERQGHIQLAERLSESMPSASGAHTMLVRASATDSTEPAAGSASPAWGAWPKEVAIPF